MGIIPDLLTTPTVGLMPTIPLTEAGQLMEPLVSVPILALTNPKATTTAEPDDEPHGLKLLPKAWMVCPP